MKRITSLITLFICVVAASMAQFQNPVDMTATQKKVSDDVLEIVFQGSVEAGWHVYSTDIADGGPTRAELTLEKQRGVKPDGKLRATGKVQKMMDDMFGMEVSYMEGTASFSQKFIITEPEYEVAGYLTYGACNDENCIPPTNVEFSFKGEKAPSNSPLKGEEKEQGAGSKKQENPSASLESSENSEDSDNPECSDSSEITPSLGGDVGELWSPVIDELKALEASSSLPVNEDGGESRSLLHIFLLGFLAGLIADALLLILGAFQEEAHRHRDDRPDARR